MKERADQERAGFDGGEVCVDAAAQGFTMAQWRLADALALEVVPDKLVGVQLGGVAWQKV